MAFLRLVRYNDDGLVPCVVQDEASGECSWWPTDEAAMRATLRYRRGPLLEPQPPRALAQGRHERQRAARGVARLDCDHDTVLLSVEPAGPACHTGAVSCFRDEANGGAATVPAAGGE